MVLLYRIIHSFIYSLLEIIIIFWYSNIKVSAHTRLEGTHDFYKIPLAPVGEKFLIHDKSRKILTWSPHGIDGCYIRPAPEHYI